MECSTLPQLESGLHTYLLRALKQVGEIQISEEITFPIRGVSMSSGPFGGLLGI